MSFETVTFRECRCRTCGRMRLYRRDPVEGPEWKCTWCGKSDAAVTPEEQDANLREFANEMRAAADAVAASKGG